MQRGLADELCGLFLIAVGVAAAVLLVFGIAIGIAIA